MKVRRTEAPNLKLVFPDGGIMRLRALLASIPLAVAAAVSLPAGTAAAAPPRCDGASWLPTADQLTNFWPTHTRYGLNCTLQLEDNNNWGVVALQNILIKCYKMPIARDGDFGPATKKALLEAQRREWSESRDIRVDGAYTQETLNDLDILYYRQKSQGNLDNDKGYFCVNG